MRTRLVAEQREHLNRSGLNQLRRGGRLPAIVFGKQKDNVMIHISTRDFQQWARQGASAVVELEIEGKGTIPVLLEAVQRHPVTQNLLHADFLHVRMDQIVRTKVPIEFSGTAKGTKVGGIVQIQSMSIDVEGLPADLPNSITVDISDLDVGDSLFVENLTLPANITALSAGNELLLSVVTPRIDPAVAAAEEEEAEEA